MAGNVLGRIFDVGQAEVIAEVDGDAIVESITQRKIKASVETLEAAGVLAVDGIGSAAADAIGEIGAKTDVGVARPRGVVRDDVDGNFLVIQV